MEIKSLFFIVILISTSCMVKNEYNHMRQKNEKAISRELKDIALNNFYSNSEIERKAGKRIKEYLTAQGMSSSEFFVYFILYPDFPHIDPFFGNSFSVAMSLTHRISIAYYDSIKDVNIKLAEQYKGEEWIPIIPPATGNISGKDRTIYYYFEQDSVVDALSQ